MDRPPPDVSKILGHLDDWRRGEQLPGRTMAYLKTAGLPDLLASRAAAGDEGAAELAEIWAPWERARALPADVLAALVDAGLPELLMAEPGR